MSWGWWGGAQVKEGVESGHVQAHVVGPLKDLGADVGKEGIRGPPAQDHDLGCGNVGQEESHGGAGADGFVSNFMGVESESGLAAEDSAGSPK